MTPASDQQLTAYSNMTSSLTQGPGERYPASDVFGLYTDDDPTQVPIATVFAQLDTTAAEVIRNNVDKQTDFLDGNRVTLAEYEETGRGFEFTRSTHEDGGIQYTITRTDPAGTNDGLSIIRSALGNCVIRSGDLTSITEQDEGHPEALKQALQLALRVQARLGVKPVQEVHTPYTGDDFTETIKDSYNKYNSLRAKAMRTIMPPIQAVNRKALDIFTQKDELGARKIRAGRVALTVLSLPAPFYSSSISEDLPVPRPASVEIAADIGNFLFADNPLTPEQQRAADFRSGNNSLPNTEPLVLGVEQVIDVVPDIPANTTTYATQLEVVIGSTDGDDTEISGMSPHRVSINGALSEQACQTVLIDPLVRTGNYTVVTPTQQTADNLSATASTEGITFCNTTDKILFPDNDILYIDVENPEQ